MSNRTTQAAGVLVGLGLTAGGVALASLARRHANASRDSAPGYTARSGHGEFDVSGRTVTIRKPRTELFDFWRDFTNLVPVMENVESIEMLDKTSGRAAWTIKAPLGRTVRVETTIVSEEANELIAWRSVEGSEIEAEGRVMFKDAPGDRGTRVTLIVAYKPPAGAAGKAVAKLFLREPEVQTRHDLKRLKMLMETGEIATSAMRKENTRAAKQENAA
ncbi:SRPBCC family protein [Allopontixanthobacter sediminis]|uniref:Cyclase n=1 Tax=Allopontixanthobacter sediminis TaxID=1689985 RepID=A0A845AXX0_9SPHN|nr:SRPBCC family protein [Allopontixanthobacter sediminis]MXP43090.1 cyclase [Allopontixanthobacter sediminis]